MRYFLTLCLCSYLVGAKAQTDPTNKTAFYSYKHQVGLNVTNILANVLSLNSNTTASPYGITYRRIYDKFSFRSAMNLKFINTTGDNLGIQSRSLRELDLFLRSGVEKYLPINKVLMVTYGVDGMVGYGNFRSKVTDLFSSSSNFFENKGNTFKYGLAPVLRLEWKLSSRIYLSTESSFIALATTTNSTLVQPQLPTQKTNKSNFDIQLSLPQSLFFNVAF